jgi:hypothetical protein
MADGAAPESQSPMNLRAAIEDLPALGVLDAHELGDLIIEQVIQKLQRDSSIPARSYSEWMVALADVRARIVEQIHLSIRNHVHIDDVLRALDGA